MMSDRQPMFPLSGLRKKWWIGVVLTSSCSLACIIYFSCYKSKCSSNLTTSEVNFFSDRFRVQCKENIFYMNKTDLLTHENCSNFVSVGEFMSNGLGNQMFYFAAALHVAEITGREFVLFHDHKVKFLASTFELNVKIVKVVCPKRVFIAGSSSFDANVEKLVLNHSETRNKSIVVKGYFQSWKYLSFIKDRIRHHLYFKADTRKVARRFLSSNIPPGWTKEFVRVGIHNRRGDFLRYIKNGYSVATEGYFQKAMKYFVRKYQRIQFIVTSLDREWSKKFIYFNDSAVANVTFAFGHSASEDMAILSMCDHVIVSTGTFGWWAGWLAGGTTIYYANYPQRNSTMSKRLIREDYYPTHWIPLE